jgi:hypothetical protein
MLLNDKKIMKLQERSLEYSVSILDIIHFYNLINETQKINQLG